MFDVYTPSFMSSTPASHMGKHFLYNHSGGSSIIKQKEWWGQWAKKYFPLNMSLKIFFFFNLVWGVVSVLRDTPKNQL